MGIWDKIVDKMQLTPDDDMNDEYDDEDYDEEYDQPAPIKSKKAPRVAEEPVAEKKPEPIKPRSFANRSNNSKSYNKGSNMEVCVFKPTNIDDGREISDTLLDGKAVVLNLEGLDMSLAQRIIDFTSGACYSIRGNLQKISNYIFIVTPENVEISGDIKELMASEDLNFKNGNMF